jgi:heat shock protein HslJ
MRLTIGLVGMSLMALLTACSASSGGSGGQLEGDWLLTSQRDGDALSPVPAGVTADATFRDGALSGSAGCNRYAAAYVVDGNALKITVGPMTLIGCEPPASTVETAYIANLGAVATYTATSETLTMFDSGGAEILVFAAMPPASLTGVTWHATGINNGTGGVVSVVAGSDPTAMFDEAGNVSGDAGCNTFTGTAAVDGSSIKIGPLATTRKACADDAISTQETAYLAALEASTTFAIRGAILELRDDSGALMVGFEQR